MYFFLGGGGFNLVEIVLSPMANKQFKTQLSAKAVSRTLLEHENKTSGLNHLMLS